VRIEKTNESELRMTCRKAILRYQNQTALLVWDKSIGHLCYWVDGIRHGSSVSSNQAIGRNLGTHLLGWEDNLAREDGVICSSDEVGESPWSEGVTLISRYYGTTIIGRTP
jgi:hypothetical protein